MVCVAEDPEFSLELLSLKCFTEHVCGASEEPVDIYNSEFKREDWSKDINLRVVSVCQATKFDGIMKGVTVDAKNGSKN